MAVPQYDELMNPTLQALKELGGCAHIREIENKVSQILSLSPEDIKDLHRGTTTKLVYRLAWSRNYLKRFGLLQKESRGIWCLTTEGENVQQVDKEDVKRFVKINSIEPNDIDDDFDILVKSLNLFKSEEETPIEIEDSTDTDIEGDEIISPFDPKDIKIIVEPRTIDHLVTRLRYNEIDLNTEFQRKGNLWPPAAQSRLIESILLRLPLPAFYFDAEDENNWLVVDGLQRLWTIKNFIVNPEFEGKDAERNPPLELTGLEILTDYNNKNITFKNLGRTMQRRILETQITTYLIQPGTPKTVKYNVFRRINTGGLGLNSMEIRNALNQGKPADFLRNLSEDPKLREILKLQDRRMEDRELLLRAFAFINKKFSEYKTPLSSFLDDAMESLVTRNDKHLEELATGIINAIYFQQELFGKDIFSRSILGNKIRLKLNSALFEVWVSEIYKLTEIERQTLLNKKANLIERYKEILGTDKMTKAVVSSTSGKGAVSTRFEEISNMIKSFL